MVPCCICYYFYFAKLLLEILSKLRIPIGLLSTGGGEGEGGMPAYVMVRSKRT